MRILDASFFNRDTFSVCEQMLGKRLVSRSGVSSIITEVEAYDGFDDFASHASRGKTKRNEVMFGEAGHWYVYLVYGMHWMVNVVTREAEYPAAILIRGTADFSGPGRVTKGFGIDKTKNALPVGPESGFWIEDTGIVISKSKIKKMPRVGVVYAKEWADKPFRYRVG